MSVRWSPSGAVWPGQLPFASRSSHAARSLHPAQAAAFRVRDLRSGGCGGKRQRMAAAAEDFARSSHESPEKGYAVQRLPLGEFSKMLNTVDMTILNIGLWLSKYT